MREKNRFKLEEVLQQEPRGEAAPELSQTGACESPAQAPGMEGGGRREADRLAASCLFTAANTRKCIQGKMRPMF